MTKSCVCVVSEKKRKVRIGKDIFIESTEENFQSKQWHDFLTVISDKFHDFF